MTASCRASLTFSAAVVLTAATSALALSGGGGFDLAWHTIDGGGGTSSGGTFALSATIGQPDAGVMSGGGYSLVGGFWAVESEGAVTPCPGDVNGDQVVDVQDLVQVVLSWGLCPPPPPACAADANGDDMVDVQDLVSVVLAWGPCA